MRRRVIYDIPEILLNLNRPSVRRLVRAFARGSFERLDPRACRIDDFIDRCQWWILGLPIEKLVVSSNLSAALRLS
jgi:hypothetical protein